MTTTRGLVPLSTIAALLVVTGCAEGNATSPGVPLSSAVTLPEHPEAPVLLVEHTGGFVTPTMLAGRLPRFALYADGRLFTQGPVDAVYPGPALPDVQVQQLEAETVQDLALRALAAGVAESDDLGMPPLADVTTTRITLVTDDATYVREAYALFETALLEGPVPGGRAGPADNGLTAEQQGDRERLQDLLDHLDSLALGTGGDVRPEPYRPESLAALVTPWVEPEDGLDHPEMSWPGPALPGEPLGPLPDLTCLTVAGDQADAVWSAALEASMLTPWLSEDGTRWSVTFRPLLPHQTGCGDLTG